MKKREIIPLKQSLDFRLVLPGSKSITNRAFLCAALSKGKTKIYGALESDDTAVMLNALRKLKVRSSKLKDCIEIEGCGGIFKKGKIILDLHNAGTAVRFLTAIMAIRDGETVITGDKRMQERPIKDLAEGLRQLGASIEYVKKRGYPPLKIQNPKSKIQNYVVRMKGDKSSQYFSALLMLGPLLDKPFRIEVRDRLVSKPYIDTTIAVMKAFGVKVQNNNYQSFVVKPQKYKATDYQIEGDASAASYWTAMAHLHEGKVQFTNLDLKKSIQGDARFSDALAKLKTQNSKLKINPKSEIRNLKSIIDMGDMPDSAMTLAVVTPFNRGQTKITGLSTLRIKETDRLKALKTELKKVGVKVGTTKDSIQIQELRTQDTGHSRSQLIPDSRVLSPIKTYNDHRMAMCFAVMGTKTPGIVIENPGCTDKTYPQFWSDLERAYITPIKLGKKDLVLTGMRGSGKTYLGKKIAQLLDREFVDLDEEIEKTVEMTIPQIVKEYGWEYFRKLESIAVQAIGHSFEPLVIATGGGVVLNEKNMEALGRNGVNVLIYADPQILAERVKKSKNRPTLTGKHFVGELETVWQERRDLYLKYADFVWDDTSGNVVKENLDSIFDI